jgi:hypothetical protein
MITSFAREGSQKEEGMAELQQYIHCVGCGALVPESDGPTHRYVGASAGCWQIHGEVLAKEYEQYRSAVAQMVVDAYCVQHPGVPGPQSIQSVAVHLMSLCLVPEGGVAPAKMPKILPQFTHKGYPWLEPPTDPGALTIVDVAAARDLAEHIKLVQVWVWQSGRRGQYITQRCMAGWMLRRCADKSRVQRAYRA